MKTNMGDPHRNFVDFAHVPVVKRLTRMPVCIDPSHSVGTRATAPDGILDIFHVTAQGVIAGANMVLVDFHPGPGEGAGRRAAGAAAVRAAAFPRGRRAGARNLRQARSPGGESPRALASRTAFMPTEVELKLSATPAAFAAVRRHRALIEANAGRAHSTSIISRYYDTPTHELFGRGVALRLRRRGTRWLQTVKGAGDAAAGMHRRAEYEWPLSRARLEPAKLATTPWSELFADAAGRLTPVFTTEVKRTERALSFDDGTRATLSFDHGTVRAGRKRCPLCEIEIELVEGDARRLYDFALALCADIPLTLGARQQGRSGLCIGAIAPGAGRVRAQGSAGARRRGPASRSRRSPSIASRRSAATPSSCAPGTTANSCTSFASASDACVRS